MGLCHIDLHATILNMEQIKLKIIIITSGVSRIIQPLIDSDLNIVGIIESMPKQFDPQYRDPFIIRQLKKLYNFFNKMPESLRSLANQKAIPYSFIWKKNTSETACWISRINPDLIVVYSMSQLLNEEIINIPKFGVINLHPSFLPDFRGPNPDFWSYYYKVLNPGVTVHYIDKGEDTGDIIYQKRINVPLGIKSKHRDDKLISECGVDLLIQAIKAIQSNNAPRIPQPLISNTIRARNILKTEYNKLIDFYNWDIERVWNILRGTETWLDVIPQPLGIYKGHRWSICEFEKRKTEFKTIGTISKSNGRFFLVLNDGIIFLKLKFKLKIFIVNFFIK